MSHNLKHNGAAYNDQAALINPDPKVTSGAGRALCTCGILSEELPTGGARRAWHKAHKAQAAQAAADTQQAMEDEVSASFRRLEAAAQTELVQGQDVLAGTPEDEVAEALAELVEAPAPEAKKVSTRRKAEQAAGFMPTAEDEPNATTLVLPFTTAITPGFWRSLGRDGAKALVDNHFPTVTVTPNNNARTLTLQGPAADVAKAAETVQAMWADALLAVKEWKKTDTAFLRRPTEALPRRQQGYHLTEAFFTQFGASYDA